MSDFPYDLPPPPPAIQEVEETAEQTIEVDKAYNENVNIMYQRLFKLGQLALWFVFPIAILGTLLMWLIVWLSPHATPIPSAFLWLIANLVAGLLGVIGFVLMLLLLFASTAANWIRTRRPGAEKVLGMLDKIATDASYAKVFHIIYFVLVVIIFGIILAGTIMMSLAYLPEGLCAAGDWCSNYEGWWLFWFGCQMIALLIIVAIFASSFSTLLTFWRRPGTQWQLTVVEGLLMAALVLFYVFYLIVYTFPAVFAHPSAMTYAFTGFGVMEFLLFLIFVGVSIAVWVTWGYGKFGNGQDFTRNSSTSMLLILELTRVILLFFLVTHSLIFVITHATVVYSAVNCPVNTWCNAAARPFAVASMIWEDLIAGFYFILLVHVFYTFLYYVSWTIKIDGDGTTSALRNLINKAVGRLSRVKIPGVSSTPAAAGRTNHRTIAGSMHDVVDLNTKWE